MWNYKQPTEMVNAEDLRVGDVCVLWCGIWRVTRIFPYKGPLKECLALVDTDIGSGFSLLRGDTIKIAKRIS